MSDSVDRDPLLTEIYSRLGEIKLRYSIPDARDPFLDRMQSTLSADAWKDGMTEARAFYEDLITSGELRSVKRTTAIGPYVTDDWYAPFASTACCRASVVEGSKFCPNCGAQIQEPT